MLLVRAKMQVIFDKYHVDISRKYQRGICYVSLERPSALYRTDKTFTTERELNYSYFFFVDMDFESAI